MNRIINILTFAVLGVFCFMVLAIVYDLAISNFHLQGLPYKRIIFTQFALLVLLLGLIRVRRRWQGMKDMKQYKNFLFVSTVAKTHRQQGIVVTSVEVLFFAATILFCTLFLDLNPEYVIPMILVLSLIITESCYFIFRLYKGGNAFRIGMDEELIAYFDREMHLYYYTGLRKVELYQQDLINFSYRDDLNLSLATNAVSVEDRKAFRDELVRILEAKNVYVDDSFRNWE